MLDVFFTVDVEVWCGGWTDLDAKFPQAFRQYIHGETSRGAYGVPYTLKLLNDHGLHGVFFVEPLFSTRFGAAPLQEIVGLVQDAGHDVQLHLHTEWVDEARDPLLTATGGKRQYLRQFSREDQTILVDTGARLLASAGAHELTAFRAGGFGFNRDTLAAVAAAGLRFDSSYNASHFGLDSGVLPGITAVEPFACDGVHEYPMTVFSDGTRALRHAQLTSCSYRELEGLLWRALAEDRRSVVLLSHGSELLNPAKTRPDDRVVQRFRKLCAFLDRNRDCFQMRNFSDVHPVAVRTQPPPLRSPLWKTGVRMLEQAYRRRYQ